jgi:3-dehydroquinate synthase
MRRLELALNQETRRSEINVGRGIRLHLAALISPSLPRRPRRIGIISNDRIFQLYGSDVVRNLKREGFKVFTSLIPEGERYKSFRSSKTRSSF